MKQTKVYKYDGVEFTDGDVLLLSYSDDEYETCKDLSVIWYVGKNADFIADHDYSENYEEDGLPIGSNYEYPDRISKIADLDEMFNISSLVRKPLRDLRRGDTVIIKSDDDEIFLKFTLQFPVSYDKENDQLESIYESESEAFYLPVFADVFTENMGYIEYLGVLPK